MWGQQMMVVVSGWMAGQTESGKCKCESDVQIFAGNCELSLINTCKRHSLRSFFLSQVFNSFENDTLYLSNQSTVTLVVLI